MVSIRFIDFWFHRIRDRLTKSEWKASLALFRSNSGGVSLFRRRFELTLFGVCPHIGRLGEALGAAGVRTLVRFESCMVVQVRLQVVLLGERLWTDRTGEGFDTWGRK